MSKKLKKKIPKKKISAPQMSQKRGHSTFKSSMRYLFPYLILLIIAVVPYLSCLNNEFVNWDDDKNIYEASTLTHPDALERIWFSFEMPSYLPLTDTLWYVESKIWGVQPQSARYFHAVSIALHAINVLLVCIVVRKLGFDLSIAWFVAVLFAVHPWHVENVAWATEQKSLLSGIFLWLAWLGYLKAARDDKLMKRPYIISIVMFLLSLLSKPTVIAMPFIFLLGEWFLGHKFNIKKGLRILPYLCLSIAVGVTTLIRELYISDTDISAFNMSLIERTLLTGKNFGYYVMHFLLPFRITGLYPKWDISAASPFNWLGLIFTVVVIAGLIMFSVKRRSKFILLCLFGYLLTLAPVSGLINMPYFDRSFIADRYTYIPLFFLVLALIQILKWFQSKLIRLESSKGSLTWAVVPVALILFWTAQTIRSISIWHDSITFWKHSIEFSQENAHPIAYNNLGLALEAKGMMYEAVSHYSKALKIKPDYAHAHSNLGIALARQGKVNEAIDHYLEALRINPDFLEVRNNLGFALASQGKIDEAIKYYLEVLRRKPNFSEAHNNLGIALARQGKIDEAIDHYLEALRIKPDYTETHNNLGTVLARQGKVDEAIDHYLKALRIKPGYAEAYANLGSAWLSLGKNQKALKSFSQAYKIFSKNLGKAHPYTINTKRIIENLKKNINRK